MNDGTTGREARDSGSSGGVTAVGADAGAVTRAAHRGAFWSLVIAGIAFPLPILRNWFAGQIDATGSLNGQVYLFILFVTAVYTFCYPGGRNVFPTYLPKLRDVRERSQLISGYLVLILISALVAIVLTSIFPGIFDAMLTSGGAEIARGPISSQTRHLLQVLIPLVLLSLLCTSAVMGSMSFVWAAVLLRAELLFVTGFLGLVYFGWIDLADGIAIRWLAIAFGAAFVVSVVVAGSILLGSHRLTWRIRFPKGCFRFAGLTWLDTVMVFAYLSIDKYFVVAALGDATLGVYGVLLDLARLIPLAMQQVGHLLLATFSKLLGSNQEESLAHAYRRVSRVNVGFYASAALVFVFFSRPLASFFGDAFESRHAVLIGLAVALSIDALKTLNAMTLMAFERMGTVLLSKVAQNVVQFAVIWLTIERWGLAGVVLGKAAGHVVNAVISCVAVARVQTRFPLLPPKALVVLPLIVGGAGVGAYFADGRSWLVSVVGVVSGWTAVWFAGGYSVAEVRSLLPFGRGRSVQE